MWFKWRAGEHIKTAGTLERMYKEIILFVLFFLFVQSADAAINLSSGNVTVLIETTSIGFNLTWNNTLITGNDYGNKIAYFWMSNSTTDFISTDYPATSYTNTSSSATLYWNTSAFSSTFYFDITDADTLQINRSIMAVGNQILLSAEMVIPLLTDNSGFDYVVLNNSLSSTDRNMYTPYIPSGGMTTRYAKYDDNVVVSDRDDRYFLINLSGTGNLTKSVRQNLSIDGNSSSSMFHFGLFNFSPYPAFEPPYSMTNGQVAWLNLTFQFNNNASLLPDSNVWINESRFSDTSIFVNTTIARDARHMVENVVIGRLMSNWYPNGSYPLIYDANTIYTAGYTALSAFRMVEGAYYFGTDNLKNILRTWHDSVENYNNLMKLQPYTIFEAENFTDYKGRGWELTASGGSNDYSGGYAIYTLSQGSGLPLHFNFSGDMVRFNISRHLGGGILNISVDNGANVTIDTYADSIPIVSTYFDITTSPLSYDPNVIPSTWHTLTIYDTGTKNTSSFGYNSIVDAIEVRRNDSMRQMWGYLYYDSSKFPLLANANPYAEEGFTRNIFVETVNITINGTVYPYLISLHSTATGNRGAVSYLGMEQIMCTYSIWKTDSNNTWLSQQMPVLEDRMDWTHRMFFNSSAKLLQIPNWYGSHSFHDAAYTTGFDAVDNSYYVTASDLMATMYNSLGDTANRNKWINRRDTVKNQMVKDWAQGGLWKNESVGGHFILIREPGWVRFEIEEDDFTGKGAWNYYNNTATVWDNGKKISGRKWRQFNESYGSAHERALYYINDGTSTINWSFNGTGLRFVHGTDLKRGKINVSIDGTNYTIDQYNGTKGIACPIFCVNVVSDVNTSLPMGQHNVTFYWTGLKNTSAIDTFVDVDAVEVLNATLTGFSAYSATPMSVNIFDSSYKNNTKDWIYWRDPRLKLDYTFPFIPLSKGGSPPPGDKNSINYMTWGYLTASPENGFENGGHFPTIAALVSRITGNYSDMSYFVGKESGKYGMSEWYWDNGTEGTGAAELETQFGGGFLMGYIPFWGASYTVSNVPLSITSSSPSGDPATTEGQSQTFSVNLERTTNVTWYINGSQVQMNTSITTASYTNTSGSMGNWNITATATDNIDTVSRQWNWTVNAQSPGTYIPPGAVNLINTTGNFWVNHTWQAGTENVTNSYNVSVNGTWHNGSTVMFRNTSTLPHGWVNITVHAFNSSGAGTLSTTGISQSTQIPNNPITITNISDSYNIRARQTLYIDANYIDADNDTGTFARNFTKGSFNTSTGILSWITGVGDAGTYFWMINVSDGHDSVSTKNFTVTVSRK